MKDPRIEKLAKNILHYSVKLQPGENLLIEVLGEAQDLTSALVKEAYAIGANPFVSTYVMGIQRDLLMNCNEKQLELMSQNEMQRMKDMQAYISINDPTNTAELSDVPGEKMQLYNNYIVKKVHLEIRVPHTKWCIMNYPSPSMAQKANMSTEAFEDFYFDVCTVDYAKMSKAMDPLVELMKKTDRVRITGKDTDLTFSIKGMPAIKCAGDLNIPDGEVFSAPLKNSVNGYITYNTPAEYQGVTYENIRLEFKDGKIVTATANDTESINKVFDTDEGARYIGEFAIGVNPYITKPMKDALFDEKIMGSIHFTPGSSYDNCNNGNKSAIHWDLVFIQTPEFGGGEIWFDDTLIRKDGMFVYEPLKVLNPENLK